MANEIGDLAALRAELDALRGDNAFLGYVIHGPLFPEQEARATKVERDALRADNERLKRVLEQAQCCILKETPECGTHEEAREDTLEKIRAALTAKDQAAERDALPDATIHAAPEYTREEMREACRNNYHAGAAVGADRRFAPSPSARGRKMADDLNGSPAARPLTAGDWIQSNDPRHGHRQARRVELITELPRWIGSTLTDTYAVAGKVRIKLRRIHLDDKPRRSGWRRVAAAAAATPER